MKKTVKEKIKIKNLSKIKPKFRFKVYDMGQIKGTLSREEIYDWL